MNKCFNSLLQGFNITPYIIILYVPFSNIIVLGVTKLVSSTNIKPRFCIHQENIAFLSIEMAYTFHGIDEIQGSYRSLTGHEDQERRRLSTEEIMRVAGERYIQFSNNKVDCITMFIHPYSSSLSSLSAEETRGADLAYLLLTAAEKVGYKQYDRASRLLTQSEYLASEAGNPVQRVSFYFAAALRERISREMGSTTVRRMSSEQVRGQDIQSSGTDFTFLASHQEFPLIKVIQFAAMQTILDSVAMDVKVHLIDLQISCGIHWMVLMQALSERKNCPIEFLKITAVATTDRQKIEETGRMLKSFAQSLNISFSFKVVFVSDIKDIKGELFDIKASEVVAVYSPTILTTMISRPDCMETLMRVIRSFNPSIMVVSEVEANHNSPSFVKRFIEALFFFSACYDCLEDCMERNNQYRVILERNHFGKGIQNIVAAEGEERVTRSVKINVWRAFFARFKMEEIAVSTSSLYRANLVLDQFSCGGSCTLENNGKCLIVGWKRTPIQSVSAWKFN